MSDNTEKFAFQNYTCVGNTDTIHIGKYSVTATIVPDEGASPNCGCYDEKDVAEWEAGNWEFVGVVLSVEYNGELISNNAASTWGIEADFSLSDTASYIAECANNLISDAIDCAWKRRGEILKALAY